MENNQHIIQKFYQIQNIPTATFVKPGRSTRVKLTTAKWRKTIISVKNIYITTWGIEWYQLFIQTSCHATLPSMRHQEKMKFKCKQGTHQINENNVPGIIANSYSLNITHNPQDCTNAKL